MRFFRLVVIFLGKWILSLRYQVEVRGLDALPNGLKGVLMLPNHPAYIDPPLLVFHLWRRFRVHPISVDYVLQIPIASFFVRLTDPVSVPNLDSSVNQFKMRKVRQVIQKVTEDLKNGVNFVLWPAGHLREGSREELGGASGTQELLQSCPDANVVLVRTTGLWGSSFSRGFWGGKYPDLGAAMRAGIKAVLQNGIFFMPRRKVLIEVALAPADFPRTGTRLEVNRYLENWYNQRPDPFTLVPTHFWDRSPLKPPAIAPEEPVVQEEFSVPSEMQEEIFKEIRTILDAPAQKIAPEMSLARDLRMDSLNIAELIAFIAHRYRIKNIHPESMKTVRDLFAAALHKIRPAENKPFQKTSLHQWPQEKNRPPPRAPRGATIPEAFLDVCERMGSFASVADDHSGVLSYRKVKQRVLVLSRLFATLPEERIAVMLPSSVGVYTVILALYMAGKTPVMLNWTLGPRYLEEMMQLSGAKTILSSWRFLEKLPFVDFGAAADQIRFLEEMRGEISLGMKLKGLFLSLCPARLLLRLLHLDQLDPDAPAVILFTSGTEASPKGVPLSHTNIMTDLRSGIEFLDLRQDDVFYGVLPPFHSFGFSITGLLPLIIGMKTVYYPDPTDGAALAQDIDHWKVTFFCAAPSFLKGLFSAAQKEQLLSVRFFISGAEKAPPEFQTQLREWNLSALCIEGYGLTECSPAVSIQRHLCPLKGVGYLLRGVELCTIHPETKEPLPKGATGEICLKGPTIFKGYLGNVSSPFIELNGEHWFRTGDVGYLDADGVLFLTDRLKRFIKVGGEMISLGAIETGLTSQLKVGANTLAVIEVEPSKLTLFATFPIDREAANVALRQYGFSALIKISAVKQIDELPLMGTGKINYRGLKTLL